MHERYDKWNSGYIRFRRWAEQGVWDALLQTLVDLRLTDDWQHMIDSTTVRGHVSASGKKGGFCECCWSISRRFYEQNRYSILGPLRKSKTAYRLHPHWWRSVRYHRSCKIMAEDVCQHGLVTPLGLQA